LPRNGQYLAHLSSTEDKRNWHKFVLEFSDDFLTFLSTPKK